MYGIIGGEGGGGGRDGGIKAMTGPAAVVVAGM